MLELLAAPSYLNLNGYAVPINECGAVRRQKAYGLRGGRLGVEERFALSEAQKGPR